jgi:hypothetical protein
VTDSDIDQMTSGLNFVTRQSRKKILQNYTEVLEAIYHPEYYYQRVVYTGLNISAGYRHKPDFKTWLVYMRSFLRVCRIAGFSRKTGWLYWKMFFTVIVRNPKGIEAAVNLAAMYIHFSKQKDYIVEATLNVLSQLEKTGESNYNESMKKSVA